MRAQLAAGVDDPVPPTPAPEAQREPPKQTLSADLRDPEAQLISAIAINHGLEEVPAKQKPPVPEPFKVPEAP